MSRASTMRGVSLVELLVSLSIGSLLVVGALTVYSNSRNTYAVNEAIARLQEQARFVLTVIEPDIELAGYWGFTNSPDTVRLVTGATPGNVLATAPQMRQFPLPVGPPVPVATLPGSAQACGTNFAVDVLTPVQGSDGNFDLGPGRTAACNPFRNRPAAGTDTLTLRRVSTEPEAPQPGRLQLYASRLTSRTAQTLFFDGVAPGPINADNVVRNLIVRSYYVAQDSVDSNGAVIANRPALRVKSLTSAGGAPTFVDNEVMPFVEDLQVQFGLDTGDYDGNGAIDPGIDANGDGIPETDGRATRYVDPDSPALEQRRSQVVAVRIWIRVRAEQAEPGFVDNRTYRYADVEFTPAGEQRNFRRLLLSRTIMLRNSRTL